MPIAPEFRDLYGEEWNTVIRPRVLKRAHYQCECCRRPLHAWIYVYTWQNWIYSRLGKVKVYNMMWIQEGAKTWRNQFGRPCSPLRAKGLPRLIRVKLTIGHADNHPPNMDELNLRCWCTWCHLHHDQPHHADTRGSHKDAKRPILASLNAAAKAKAEIDDRRFAQILGVKKER